MRKLLLLRFGDLLLKGDNKKLFLDKINNSIREKLKELDVKIKREHDRVFLDFDEDITESVLKQLSYVPGLYSYSFVYQTAVDLDSIAALSIELLRKEIKEQTTFKVETKRADKDYPLTSLEISMAIAPKILSELGNLLVVDVRKPKTVLHVEIRKDMAFIFTDSIKGMGGFPMGTGGKAVVMMSGGIDSPVACYLMMKQGVEIELLHFESTPLTPLESVQKVIDLAKVLANYMPRNEIKLHMVPFIDVHQEILKNVNDPYIITILRRHMYRLGERFARLHKASALVNGESVGQVASQTLESINVVENVTNMAILRPLITYDKLDIINIARRIETFDISIRPFNDCCSIYVPKHPVTHPKASLAESYEKSFSFENLLEEALKNTVTIKIHKDLDFEISEHGFSVKEAITNYYGEKNDRIETK